MNDKSLTTTHALLLAVIVIAGCKEQTKTETAALSPNVKGDQISFPSGSKQEESLKVETVTPRTLNLTRLTGRLAWDDDVTVRIFSPVAGRVTSILVKEGQKVNKDDVLARVASPDFWQAQTEAKRATSDLALSEKVLTRTRDLFKHGAAAQKDLDAAETDFIQKTSERQRALSLLELYGGKIEAPEEMHLFPLRALLDGTLVERNLTQGQEVRPDTQLGNAPNIFAPYFVGSDPTRLWLWVDVNELGINELKQGQKLRLYSPAYTNQVFEGEIDWVGNSLNPDTRTVKVRARVGNPDKLLKAEMYVTVDIDEQQPPGFDISGKAVFLDLRDNQHYLFVEQSPGEYVRRQVKVGMERNGRISILDGVTEGQRVVTEGALLLKTILEGGAQS